MECSRCKQPIAEGEECTLKGRTLCEDCFVQAVEPRRTCDVAAVSAATSHKETSGQTGSKGLTEEQRIIYECIQRNSPLTLAELSEQTGVSQDKLEIHLTTLRHCELVKRKRTENGIFIVPFYVD